MKQAKDPRLKDAPASRGTRCRNCPSTGCIMPVSVVGAKSGLNSSCGSSYAQV